MKKITPEELKTLQLDILSAVDCFCDKYRIRYSMGCGTLLGAIRHKGYIPWDDDIDIYMLRKDYNRFEKLFPQVYDGHYCLSSFLRDSRVLIPFAKVYDNRTIIQKRSKNLTPGVNIDLFIIDDVPDEEDEWVSFNRKRKAMIKKLRHSSLKVSSINSWKKNIAAIVYSIRYAFLNQHTLTKEIIDFAQSYNGKGNRRVFETTLGMNLKKPFPKSLFDNIVDLPFENRLFKGFKNYDEYLTASYGNYMELPPLEKRVSFHTFDAYWKD